MTSPTTSVFIKHFCYFPIFPFPFLQSSLLLWYKIKRVRSGCQLIVSHIMVLANTLTSDISVKPPILHYYIRPSSSNSFKPSHSLPISPSVLSKSHFAVLCAVVDWRKNALKTQENSLIPHFCGTVAKRNNFRDTRGAPVGFCNTLVFPIFSHSNPLKLCLQRSNTMN